MFVGNQCILAVCLSPLVTVAFRDKRDYRFLMRRTNHAAVCINIHNERTHGPVAPGF